MAIYFIDGVTPTNLTCETTTSSIKVLWTQPDPLGVVKQYIVARNGSEGKPAESKTTTEKFSTFENLALYTPYQISVTTENNNDNGNGGGEGDPAIIECKTDPKGTPRA